MSKTIRVQDDIYEQLEKIRDWKETFSQVLGRLLKVYKTIYTIRDILGPGHYLMKHGTETTSTDSTTNPSVLE
jgi:hypothetical protein